MFLVVWKGQRTALQAPTFPFRHDFNSRVCRRPYTMRKGEPMFVSRSTLVKGQHGDDVNTLLDEKSLKNSLAAGGGSSLSMWQV